jgi:hypothetical protein
MAAKQVFQVNQLNWVFLLHLRHHNAALKLLESIDANVQKTELFESPQTSLV